MELEKERENSISHQELWLIGGHLTLPREVVALRYISVQAQNANVRTSPIHLVALLNLKSLIILTTS